jgi:hypothetical protein
MKMILAAMMFLSVFQRNAMAFAPKFMSVRRPSVATFATRTAAQQRVISDEVLGLINSQVTVELSASQLYLSASIWCDQHDLIGMAAYVSDRTWHWTTCRSVVVSSSIAFVLTLSYSVLSLRPTLFRSFTDEVRIGRRKEPRTAVR